MANVVGARGLSGVGPAGREGFALFGLDPAEFDINAENYLDLSLDYSPQWIGIGETTLSMGVSNVLDNDPPVIKLGGPGNTIAGMYDPLGRYFFFGVTQKF